MVVHIMSLLSFSLSLISLCSLFSPQMLTETHFATGFSFCLFFFPTWSEYSKVWLWPTLKDSIIWRQMILLTLETLLFNSKQKDAACLRVQTGLLWPPIICFLFCNRIKGFLSLYLYTLSSPKAWDPSPLYSYKIINYFSVIPLNNGFSTF